MPLSILALAWDFRIEQFIFAVIEDFVKQISLPTQWTHKSTHASQEPSR